MASVWKKNFIVRIPLVGAVSIGPNTAHSIPAAAVFAPGAAR